MGMLKTRENVLIHVTIILYIYILFWILHFVINIYLLVAEGCKSNSSSDICNSSGSDSNSCSTVLTAV